MIRILTVSLPFSFNFRHVPSLSVKMQHYKLTIQASMKKRKRKAEHPVPITAQEMSERQFLSIQEAAYILQVTTRIVGNLMRQQQLQSVKVSVKKTLISDYAPLPMR